MYKKEDAFTTMEAEDQNKIILALQGKQSKLAPVRYYHPYS